MDKKDKFTYGCGAVYGAIFIIIGLIAIFGKKVDYSSQETSYDRIVRESEEDKEFYNKIYKRDMVWSYKSLADRGVEASIMSINRQKFGEPYIQEGGSYFTLKVIQNGSTVKAILEVSTGAFDLYQNNPKDILVSFDGSNLKKYPMNEYNSNFRDVVYIGNAKEFVSRLKKASNLVLHIPMIDNVVEMSYYAEFNVEGLKL